MQKFSFSLLFVVLCSLASTLYAKPTPHTWHTINVEGATYKGTLQTINELASFVTPAGEALTTFTVSPGNPVKYGFIFDPSDDFDVAYTLTLTEQSMTYRFSSKACVFVVTASGPAKPDIRSFGYNGANCSYQVVKGVGEDFFVN